MIADIEAAISSTTLPAPLQWYVVSGQHTYGASGVVGFSIAAVLIHHVTPRAGGTDLGYGFHDDELGKWFTIQFFEADDQMKAKQRIDEAIKALTEA